MEYLQQILRLQKGFQQQNPIQEIILLHTAVGLCFYCIRYLLYLNQRMPFKRFYGALYILFPLSHIGAKRNIRPVPASFYPDGYKFKGQTDRCLGLFYLYFHSRQQRIAQ